MSRKTTLAGAVMLAGALTASTALSAATPTQAQANASCRKELGANFGSATVSRAGKITCTRKKAAAPQQESYDGITWDMAREYCRTTYYGYDYVTVRRWLGKWQCVVSYLRAVPPHALKKT